MKSSFKFICIILLIIPVDVFAQAQQVVSGQMIVRLKESNNIQSLVSRSNSIGIQVQETLWPELNIYLLSYTSTAILAKNTLDNDPDIQYSQFNHIVTSRNTTPNDTRYSEQWSLNNSGQSGGTTDADVDAPEAWDISTGGTTVTGERIVIAVIDGGFDLNHTDLSFFKNTHEIPGNGIDDDGNGYIDDYDGWNAINSNGTIPNYAHGTHVAGIAAARGNNNTGVSGVNWNAKILPIAGSSSDEATVVRAYRYAWKMRQLYNQTGGVYGAFIVVTNSSFGIDQGDPADYPLWSDMYDTMGSEGILSCAATANANWNIDVVGDVPTACSSNYLVAVTNTTHTDEKYSGAAYGANTIDLGAPGTSILSTTPSNNYGLNTGTSMASPHVAGTIALMFAVLDNATLTAYKNNPSTKALEIKSWLLAAVDQMSSLSGITVTGGRLNTYKAVLYAKGFQFQFVNKIENTQYYGSLVVDNDNANPVSSGGYKTFNYNTSHTVRTNELPFIVNWNGTGKTEKHYRFFETPPFDYSLNRLFTSLPSERNIIEAKYDETKPVTINNPMLDGSTGGPANILFRDPWKYYIDGNNDWIQSNQFISYSTPFDIQNNSTNSYGGIFLNQPIESGKPSYSVSAPATQTINSITSYFLNWSGSNVVIESPNTQETGIVFTQANATVTANYKGHRYSTSSNATLGNGQRKVVRAIDGNGHYAMVYESMNRIWLTTSSDGSSWGNEIEISDNANNRIHKYPSLAVSGNIIAVVWQSESDDNYDFVLHLRKYDISTGELSSPIESVYWHYTGELLGTIEAKPVIAAIRMNYDGSGDDIMIAWRVPGEGIYVKTHNTFFGYGWATAELVPNTNSNCVTPSITNVYWYGDYNYHLCWKNNTTGQIAYTELSYDYQGDDIEFYNAATLAPTGWSENYYPSIIFSPDNKVTVAWQSYDEVAEGISVVVRQKSSGTWGNITSFSIGATYQAEPVLGTYRYGSTYNRTELVWTYGNTVYASTHNGSTWSNPEIVASGAIGGGTASIIPHSRSTANPNSILKIFRNSNNRINTLIWGDLQKTDMAEAKSVSFRLNKHALQSLETNPELSEKGYKGLIAYEIAGLSYQTPQSSKDIEVMFDDSRMKSSSFVVGTNSDVLKLAGAYYAKGLHVPEDAKLSEINDMVSVTLKDAKTKEVVKDLWKVPFSRLSMATTTDGEFRTQNIPLYGLTGKEVFLEVSMHGSAQPLFVEDYYIISTEETNLKKFFAETPQLPTEYSLHQNYPNPFNPSTTIGFDLVEPQNVTLTVYNPIGQKVKELVNEYYTAGSHEVVFNASTLSSGAYFYRLTASKYSAVKSFMLLK